MRRITPKARLFWPAALLLLCADCATKRVAVERLSPPRVPHEVVGDVVRFTLAYNEGAAMGLPIGRSRVLLIALSCAVLAFIVSLYRRADAQDRALALATGLVVGGALGNLLDRVRWDRGVVDFIDVGLGGHRFWVFNLADVGVTLGALVLILVLSRRHPAPQAT